MAETDSVASRVIAMFVARPNAVIDIADLAATHKKPITTMRSLLSDACAAGILKREGTEYSRGPQFPGRSGAIDAAQTAGSRYFSPHAVAPMPQRANRGPYVRIDPASVVLEDGIPIVDARSAVKREEWSALLLKMNVGQSFVLPVCKRAQLSKAMAEQHKASLKRWRQGVLLPEKTHFRVWRVEDAEAGAEGEAQ